MTRGHTLTSLEAVKRALRKWAERCRFASKTLRTRGIASGLRFLVRWYYARLWEYPHTINFEVSSNCNLKCPFCYSHSKGDLSGRTERTLGLQTFKRIIDDSQRFCTTASLHGMGEPLLNKELFDMIAYARYRDIDTSFSTNGLLLTEERARRLVEAGLNYIVLSVDGTSEGTYLQHRRGAKPGDFSRLLENIRTLVRLKRELTSRVPWTILQFIVTKKNLHEVPQVTELARSLEVDEAQLMSLAVDAYVRDPQFVEGVMNELFVPSTDAFSRYEVAPDGRPVLVGTEKGQRRCPQLASEPVITSDSRVTGCCKDLHTLDDTFGDLTQQTFVEVWKDRAFRKFRKEVMMPGLMKKCDSCFPEQAEFSVTVYRRANHA